MPQQKNSSHSTTEFLHTTIKMQMKVMHGFTLTWSARMSNNRQVASSEPVANADPLGKYYKKMYPAMSNIIFITNKLGLKRSMFTNQACCMLQNNFPAKAEIHPIRLLQ